ncbi:hypothetical protein OS493_007622 [Desmophyllum pertusum]|uniref:Uncharacterized protein n=1 Tax=Desmophyllum pertusum TaxID=174260 RepID=A0A9W9YRQ6_9CNID|nr:hypothetical protein OS493_007622 [Desmophyllum pertusum]
MVEHQNVRGSPFVWQVKDRQPGFTAGAKKMKMTSSAARQDATVWSTVFREGLFCWKLKLVSFTGQARKALEIGVKTSMRHGGLSFGYQQEKCSWQYNPGITQDVGHSSRSDGQKPSIVSVQDHDVFTVFLNLETKKLIIYNVRSKQFETFTDVEGELVPLYTPSDKGLFRFSDILTSYLTLA